MIENSKTAGRPKGKRTLSVPTTDTQKKGWEKLRSTAAKQVVNEQGEPKRAQIDTWAAVDEWGFTPEEFRVLYCLARHERWTGGQQKKRLNGCYASAEKIRQLTGISRNKIFQVLALFREAKIISKDKARSRTPANRGRKGGPTFAGWTNEYVIQPITQWATPWEVADLREKLQQKKTHAEVEVLPTATEEEQEKRAEDLVDSFINGFPPLPFKKVESGSNE